MANQAQQLTLPTPRTYTRTDFAALRAFVQHIGFVRMGGIAKMARLA